MSQPNFQSFRPKPLNLSSEEQDTMENIMSPTLTWPQTPRGSSASFRLWSDNPYVTPAAEHRNHLLASPQEQSSSKTTDNSSNKENTDPQGRIVHRRSTPGLTARKFGNLKTSRVLQELDNNNVPTPDNYRNSRSGL